MVACRDRISMPLIRPNAARGADAQMHDRGGKGSQALGAPLLRLRGVAYFGGKVLAIPVDQKSAARILRPH
jgi:hypothetical protein